MSLILGLSFASAQHSQPATASKATVVKKSEVKTSATTAKEEVKTEKTAAKPAAKMKKDGTPDKRFKTNKHLKKDGTPDQRFKENKK